MSKLKNRPAPSITEQRITSLEIAKLTGQTHANLLKSIRKQEFAWEKINGVNFYSVEYKDSKGELRPMYELTKMESLYIISKYNDEARAKLVKRWYELELDNKKVVQGLSQSIGDYPEETIIAVKMGSITNQIYVKNGIVFAKYVVLAEYIGYTNKPSYGFKRLDSKHSIKVKVGREYHWYIDEYAFGEMVRKKRNIPFNVVQTVYSDVYGIEQEANDEITPYSFGFTDSEMLDIVEQINKKPVNKSKVLEMLFNGKIELI